MFPIYQWANKDDPLYRNIIQKNYQKYWQFFESKLQTPIPEDFKELVQGILASKPDERYSLVEIEQSKYLAGDAMASDEVVLYMKDLRKELNVN